MRGRKQKPTAQKIFEGNRGKRPLPKNEPKPRGLPSCPAWLRKEARSEWKRIVPELARMGMLGKVDRAALAGYCQAYAKWKEAEEFILKYGFTYQYSKRDNQGNVMGLTINPYPQVIIARDSLAQMHKFLTEFGMTPASRVHLDIVPNTAEDDDPIEQILRELESSWEK